MTLSARRQNTLDVIRQKLSEIRKRVLNHNCKITADDEAFLKKQDVWVTTGPNETLDRQMTAQAIARKRLALKDEVKEVRVPKAPRRTDPQLKSIRETGSALQHGNRAPENLAATG